MWWDPKIKAIAGCRVAADLAPYGTFYLLSMPPQAPQPASCWLVAEYDTLTTLATQLRFSPALRLILARNRVRLGLRGNDLPPTTPDQQISKGPDLRKPNPVLNHLGSRAGSPAATVNVQRAANDILLGQTTDPRLFSGGAYRETDLLENVQTFWEKKTPECHHIVEDNQLRALGISHREGDAPLDRRHLPCVLLAAEFHQNYLTRILSPTRLPSHTVLSGNPRMNYYRKLEAVYTRLYPRSQPLFLPLWDMARLILDESEQMF